MRKQSISHGISLLSIKSRRLKRVRTFYYAFLGREEESKGRSRRNRRKGRHQEEQKVEVEEQHTKKSPISDLPTEEERIHKICKALRKYIKGNWFDIRL